MKKVIFDVGIMLLSMWSLTACSNGDDEVKNHPEPDEVTEIGIWPHPGTGQKIKVIDETANYDNVFYSNTIKDRTVKVDHVSYDKMPEGLKETLKQWGMSGKTNVFRCEWNDKTFYHLVGGFYEDSYGVYDTSGEHMNIQYSREYQRFIEKSKNVVCVMILKPETQEEVIGAPNHLVGIWQNDWEHTHYNDGGMKDTIVTIHKDNDIFVKQIKSFDSDGQGYLRTIIYNRHGGDTMVATDRFRYELNDYSTYSNSYENYCYTCYFEGGDTIKYQAMMREGGAQNFDHLSMFGISYPWYKMETDDLREPNAMEVPPIYCTPDRLESDPYVGKWVGYSYGESMVPQQIITWVFRENRTGYWMSDNKFVASFAFTDFTKQNTDGYSTRLICYDYDTGFISWEATKEPVERMLSVSADGMQMTMEDMYYYDSMNKRNLIKFHRVK